MGSSNKRDTEREAALTDMIRVGEEIRAVDPELFDANEHWVNNPLITPVNKLAMFNEAIARAKDDERKRAVILLELDVLLEIQNNPDSWVERATAIIERREK